MIDVIWEVIVVFFTASVKFLFSPFTAVGLGLNYISTVIVTTLGATTGVVVFYFSAGKLMERARKKKLAKILKNRNNPKFKLPKSFTKTNKLLVKIKHNLGVWGVAFVALPFVSIPIGSIIAAKFFRHNKLTPWLMVFAIFCWSNFLTLLATFIF